MFFLLSFILLSSAPVKLMAMAVPVDCRNLLVGDEAERRVQGRRVRMDVLRRFEQEVLLTVVVPEDQMLENLRGYRAAPTPRNEALMLASLRPEVLSRLKPVLGGFQSVEDFEDALQVGYLEVFEYLDISGEDPSEHQVPDKDLKETFQVFRWDLRDKLWEEAYASASHHQSEDEEIFRERLELDRGFADLVASDFISERVTAESIAQSLETADQRRFIDVALFHLSARNEHFIRRRDLRDETFKTIARKLGLTETRVMLIHRAAIHRLRDRFQRLLRGLEIAPADLLEPAFVRRERTILLPRPDPHVAFSRNLSKLLGLSAIGADVDVVEKPRLLRTEVTLRRSPEMIELQGDIDTLFAIRGSVEKSAGLPEETMARRLAVLDAVLVEKRMKYLELETAWNNRLKEFMGRN